MTFSLEDITLAAATSIAVKPTRPVSPLPISLQLSSATFLKADANIRIAIDIPIIRKDALVADLKAPPILSKSFKDPIKFPNKTVTAPRALINRFGSISAIATSEAVNKAIAPAILRRAPALSCCCHATKLSLTPLRISLMLSRNPPSSKTSVKPLTNFLIPRKIPVNIPPLTRSKA